MTGALNMDIGTTAYSTILSRLKIQETNMTTKEALMMVPADANIVMSTTIMILINDVV